MSPTILRFLACLALGFLVALVAEVTGYPLWAVLGVAVAIAVVGGALAVALRSRRAGSAPGPAQGRRRVR